MALTFKKPRDYDARVFVNCPFDDKYKPLFDAIVFTIHDLGFQARHALIDDSAAIRIERIVGEIATCKYSIHDMSRVELGKNKLPRFNMPFEAGIAYTVHALEPKGREHHMGVLDSMPYQYQASISDLAGLDPKPHSNDPDKAIQCVRELLQRKSGLTLPGAAHVRKRFRAFETQLAKAVKADGFPFTLAELNSWSYVNDRQMLTAEWILDNPA